MEFFLIVAAGCVIYILIVGFSSSVSYKNNQKKEKKKAAVLEIQHQSKREKYSSLIEKMTLEQKNLIENANQEKLINLHKTAIAKCKNNAFTRKFAQLEKLRGQLKKDIQIISDLAKFYGVTTFGDLRGKFKELIDERADSGNSNLFIAKLKNTIDSKLYLVVGTTQKVRLSEVYQDDSVVDLIDEIKFIEMNSIDAEALSTYLVNHLKPDGNIDPFSKFDGYENIIEMRLLKAALLSIDDFLKAMDAFNSLKDNQKILYTHEELKDKFKEFEFQDTFNSFLNTDKRYHVKILFLDLIEIIDCFYKKEYPRVQRYIEKFQKDFEDELETIIDNFEEWKAYETELMESHIDDCSVFTKKRLTYITDEHPISSNCKALSLPWNEDIGINTKKTPSLEATLRNRYPSLHKLVMDGRYFNQEIRKLVEAENDK